MSTIKCPACGDKILPAGIKNHISGKAEAEAFGVLTGLLRHYKNKPMEFVSSILIKQRCKHLAFYLKNSKEMPDGKLSLKYFKF